MKNILIPTDFSQNALHAIEYAKKLFWCEQTSFYILHAYADEVYGHFGHIDEKSFDTKKKEVEESVKQALEKLVGSVTETPPNPKHRYETLSAFDSLVDAANDLANQINVDLIVMGTRGQTADKKVTFGSHTVQVFKYVKCPVLAIPDKAEFHQPKRILFATDYMLPYKRRELKLLDSLAMQYKSEVHCLYISDFDSLSHRQLDNRLFLTETLPNAVLHFKRTSVKSRTEAIKDFIQEHQMDFLVMVNSRHSLLEDMLYRSTVDELGLSVDIPFLVMQNLPR